MRRRRRSAAAVVLALVAAVTATALLARDRSGHQPPAPQAPQAPAQPPVEPSPAPPPSPAEPGPSLAVGLTEMNPALIWSAASGTDVGPFAPWRDRVAALRPRYLRVLVDWSALQPDPATPPNFDLPGDGCQRGMPPCRAFGGLRELVRAAASQQRAGGGFEIVLSIYGVPAWASNPASGCERPGIAPRSRPINAAGLDGYRALVRGLVALGAQEGVPLTWWSAWNEPNGPFFVSPQRVTCDPGSPSLAPAMYTQLYRALRDELATTPGDKHLILGEMADVVTRRPLVSSADEFLSALPDDVICSATVLAQHAYAEPGQDPRAGGVVADVERVLDRQACARTMPIWITETGAGGVHAGDQRPPGEANARAQCRALHAALRRWWRDPRVTAAFQYTFRDDQAFPVGLADAGLLRAWPTGDLLAAWGGSRPPSAPPPARPASCATVPR